MSIGLGAAAPVPLEHQEVGLQCAESRIGEDRPLAALDVDLHQVHVVVLGLPKTRSGKIMRRILRKIAEGNYDELGDITTLAEPQVVEQLVAAHKASMAR